MKKEEDSFLGLVGSFSDKGKGKKNYLPIVWIIGSLMRKIWIQYNPYKIF